MSASASQAAAWLEVWKLLEANNPRFAYRPGTGLQNALDEIQRLIDGQCRETAPAPEGRIADAPFYEAVHDEPEVVLQ